jgi:hypothetical protein
MEALVEKQDISSSWQCSITKSKDMQISSCSPIKSNKNEFEVDIVAHTHNPSTQAVETGLCFKSQPGLHSESLSPKQKKLYPDIILVFRKKKIKKLPERKDGYIAWKEIKFKQEDLLQQSEDMRVK